MVEIAAFLKTEPSNAQTTSCSLTLFLRRQGSISSLLRSAFVVLRERAVVRDGNKAAKNRIVKNVIERIMLLYACLCLLWPFGT
jgi:hypothetical protein